MKYTDFLFNYGLRQALKHGDSALPFISEIERRGLITQWAEGLGLEDPTERISRILRAKEAVYRDRISLGATHTEAIEEALGLGPRHRGDLTKAKTGLTEPLDGLE